MTTDEREREMHRLETISRLTKDLLLAIPSHRMQQVMNQYPGMPRERVARKVAEEMFNGGAR